MAKKYVEEWKLCAVDTLGSVLYKTLDKWLDKVLFADIKFQTKRFVEWAREMQRRGHFGLFSGPAPARALFARCLDESEGELKRLRDFANGQKWPFRTVAVRQVHKAERFHGDTMCFILELLKVLPNEAAGHKECEVQKVMVAQEVARVPRVAGVQKEYGVQMGSSVPPAQEKVPNLYPTLTDPPPYGDRKELQMPLHRGQDAASFSGSSVQDLGNTDPQTDVWVIKGGVVRADPLIGSPQYVDQTRTYIDSLATGADTSANDSSPAANALPKLALELSERLHDSSISRPREVRNNIHDCRDKSPLKAYQMPLARAVVGRGQEVRTYTPFALQDVALLKQALPPLEKGGSPWINEFLKQNAGNDLAIGDWRRVFSACSNVSALTALEEKVGTINLPDQDPLSTVIDRLWPVMREVYPLKLTASELYSLPLKPGERGAMYLQRTREYWELHTGEDPLSADDSVSLLYRGAVETSMPTPIKESLKRVVGLSAMDFSMWTTYIVHYIDLEDEKSAQAFKNLADMKGQLVKVQLQQAKDEVSQNKADRQMTVMPAGNSNNRAQQREFRGVRRGFRNSNQSGNGIPDMNACFYCRQYGHWKKNCPKLFLDSRQGVAQPMPVNSMPYYGPAGQQSVPPPPFNPSCQTGQQLVPTGPHLAPGERQMPQ